MLGCGVVEMMDNLFFNRIIHIVQMNNINTTTILEKYKMLPKCKPKMNIDIYKMILMLVIYPTFKINVFKMEHAFHFGYCEGDKVFYVSPLN